jgi:pimeloyl-ACP methyl ester carboxylesterase
MNDTIQPWPVASRSTGRRANKVRGRGAGCSKPRIAIVDVLRLGDGRRLAVRRWRGVGLPVVLVHGLLDSSEGWSDVCAALNQPCIAFDVPGFGSSDGPEHASIEGYARDLEEALGLLGVGRFVLAGHSLGGAIATALAEALPDRVAALVLLAPTGFGRILLAEAVSLPGARSFTRALLPFALASRVAVSAAYVAVVSNGVPPAPGVVDRVVGRGARLAPGVRDATRAVADAGRSERAFHRRHVAYSGPVLAVWGDRDRLVPASHRHGVRHALPQAELRLWGGMGHHVQRERHDDLVALINRAAAASTSAGRASRRAVAARAAATAVAS